MPEGRWCDWCDGACRPDDGEGVGPLDAEAFLRDVAALPVSFLFQRDWRPVEAYEICARAVEGRVGRRVRRLGDLCDASLGEACLDVWRLLDAAGRPYSHWDRQAFSVMALACAAWMGPIAHALRGMPVPAPLDGRGLGEVPRCYDLLGEGASEALGRGDFAAFNDRAVHLEGCPLQVVAALATAAMPCRVLGALADALGLCDLEPHVGEGPLDADGGASLLCAQIERWTPTGTGEDLPALECGPYRSLVLPVARAQAHIETQARPGL